MSSELYIYIVLAIVAFMLVNKIKLDDNMIIAIVVIGGLIYYKYSKNELFVNQVDPKAMCNLMKENMSMVTAVKNEKCKKAEVTKLDKDANPRVQMNDAIDCYNYAGNMITTEKDTNSWCKLEKSDLDIIDAATKKLDITTVEGPESMNKLLTSMNLATYNDMDNYATF